MTTSEIEGLLAALQARTAARPSYLYGDEGSKLVNPDGPEAADEIERLRKTALWLSQAAGGCEGIVCADLSSPNCHCTERLTAFYRSAGPAAAIDSDEGAPK